MERLHTRYSPVGETLHIRVATTDGESHRTKVKEGTKLVETKREYAAFESPEFQEAEHNVTQAKIGKLWQSLRDSGYERLTWPDYARLVLRTHDEMFCVADDERADTSVADDMVMRTALSNAIISEVFTTNVGTKLVAGAANEYDSTKGWVHETSAASFLPATLVVPERGARLERQNKGKPAEHMSLLTKGQSWGIARYTGQYVLDEQSMLDGQHVRATELLFSEMGAAGTRLRQDLIYSLILSNPTISDDSTALFHSNHANLASGGGSAFSESTLDTAIGAIGLQYLTVQTDGSPIHLNLRAGYLVVPPQLAGKARRAARNLTLGDGGEIEVRQESRLSAVGVIDPEGDSVVTGSATNWLLAAAKASARPAIVVGGLDGSLIPRVRQSKLDRGQWGVHLDICLDIGAAAIDHRGVYFATGA